LRIYSICNKEKEEVLSYHKIECKINFKITREEKGVSVINLNKYCLKITTTRRRRKNNQETRQLIIHTLAQSRMASHSDSSKKYLSTKVTPIFEKLVVELVKKQPE